MDARRQNSVAVAEGAARHLAYACVGGLSLAKSVLFAYGACEHQGEAPMNVWTWWAEDTLVPLPILKGFSVVPSLDYTLIARLSKTDETTVRQRFASAHRCYVAWVGTVPAAYGWVALAQAEVGELALHFAVPADERYLWDFATLPAWRGQGLYPRLLQSILVNERAMRFWIIHAPENGASARGIEKASFRPAGLLSFVEEGGAVVVSGRQSARARAAARLLRVPLMTQRHARRLNPCWTCFTTRRRTTGTLRLCDQSCRCALPSPGVQ